MPVMPLSSTDLRLQVDAAALGFEHTGELLDLPLPWIGQERAEQAARFGLRMVAPDYHLFVLGDTGSGRTTLMRQLMEAVAAERPVPPDLCYLHHFDAPERPRALRLPAGEGRVLRQRMVDLARLLAEEVPKRLAAPDVRSEAERLQAAAKAEEDQAFGALSARAESLHFGLLRDEGRLVFTQRGANGQPLTAEQALALPPAERAAIDAAEESLRGEIARYVDAARARERVGREALAALRRRIVKPMVERELQEIRNALRKQIKDTLKLGRYLDEVLHEVLENVELFVPLDEPDEVQTAARMELLDRLRVNLVVDHHGATGAPVIVDDNPVFRSLFGSVEYEAEGEMLLTDVSHIRAGSLLRAHGGFLMLHLRDLLADPPVWEKLRRFLRSGRLQIEEPGMVNAPVAAVSLQPEGVDVDVKLVLIASSEEYYLVQEGDPEFARRFRCKVDFAANFPATADSRRATAIFVACTCRSHGLPHFDAGAVAALIESTHREAEDQARQSAVFARTEALVLEAAMQARGRGAPRVQADDVRQALAARRHRHDAPEQRVQEAIVDGDRLLDVHGERIGQVNGLTVLDLGDHAFGSPVCVTAVVHAGDDGLLDIEREVELSGPIHDKGVLILHSHLAGLFAHIAPLALNASLVFEQEYGGVEGDSASCAEFYALLSALAGVPLRQGIAVTGALNQHGAVLPVGGINEKIEGFFETCRRLGLDGRQGVLIPRRNRRHLMLDAAVVEAVAQGRFHLWAVDRAGEGLELLCGLPYGQRGADGYEAGSVLGRAERTLQSYRRACDAARTCAIVRR